MVQNQNTNSALECEAAKTAITKTYYSINVEMARYAHSLNSFREFKPHQQTDEYRQSVDDAWEIVERNIGKLTSENIERLKYLADKYAKKLAAWYNASNSNDAKCPSIMISGAGNFSVRKKEKQNSRRSSLMQEYEGIENILVKMKNIAYTNAIKSSSENVVEQLESKLENLQTAHQLMKDINAHWRKHGTMQGFSDWSNEKAFSFDMKMANRESWQGHLPYASYTLSNSNQNIKSVKDRLAQIKRDKEIAATGGRQYNSTGICEVIENETAMRIQLIFDGKPSESIRQILKSSGFKYSPRFSAWQRQLNNNGRYAVKKALEKIKALDKSEKE